MRKIFLLLISSFYLIGCKSQKTDIEKQIDLAGIYFVKDTSEKLEINTDGNYILYNPKGNDYYEIEKCVYASKGKWKLLSNDVFEITSEDYQVKQKGFEYELKKENKYSQDSLYINVKFPNDLHPVKLNFYFNNSNNKSIHTESTVIKLLKSKYLLPKSTYSINRNHITFTLDANISGTNLYNGRILFEIFEEDVDTEKTNYLTITLPNFDLCFYEFEPYNQEIIFIKNTKELFWKGYVWNKLHN
jgi:hypothetical protein